MVANACPLSCVLPSPHLVGCVVPLVVPGGMYTGGILGDMCSGKSSK